MEPIGDICYILTQGYYYKKKKKKTTLYVCTRTRVHEHLHYSVFDHLLKPWVAC